VPSGETGGVDVVHGGLDDEWIGIGNEDLKSPLRHRRPFIVQARPFSYISQERLVASADTLQNEINKVQGFGTPKTGVRHIGVSIGVTSFLTRVNLSYYIRAARYTQTGIGILK
jgi:hypothetical protein